MIKWLKRWWYGPVSSETCDELILRAGGKNPDIHFETVYYGIWPEKVKKELDDGRNN